MKPPHKMTAGIIFECSGRDVMTKHGPHRRVMDRVLVIAKTDVDCEQRHRILARRRLEVVHCGTASPPAAFFLAQLAVLLRDSAYFRRGAGDKGGKLPDLHEISAAAATSLRGLPDQDIFPITKKLPL